MANTSRSDEPQRGKPPVGRVEPPYLPRPEPVRVRPPRPVRPAPERWGRRGEETDEALAELESEWVEARERRMPEGASPQGWAHAWSVMALIGAGMFMVTAIALALARYFGWAAVVVGVMLMLLYTVIGGGAEWLAARLRQKDRREAEEEVTVRMREFERPGRDEPE